MNDKTFKEVMKELILSLDNIREKLAEIESEINDIRRFGIRQAGTADCDKSGCHHNHTTQSKRQIK